MISKEKDFILITDENEVSSFETFLLQVFHDADDKVKESLKANPNFYKSRIEGKSTPIFKAVENGSNKVLKCLLECYEGEKPKRFPINSAGDTPLHKAVKLYLDLEYNLKTSNEETINILLKSSLFNSEALEYKNVQGITALDLAAGNEKIKKAISDAIKDAKLHEAEQINASLKAAKGANVPNQAGIPANVENPKTNYGSYALILTLAACVYDTMNSSKTFEEQILICPLIMCTASSLFCARRGPNNYSMFLGLTSCAIAVGHSAYLNNNLTCAISAMSCAAYIYDIYRNNSSQSQGIQ